MRPPRFFAMLRTFKESSIVKALSVNGELIMTTAATAKIIKLAGSSNPPSLVALYGGTLGERKSAMSDLQNDLFSAGLSIIDFNARRYLSENDLSQPLIQQIVTELKANTDTTGATADLVNRINESAPAISFIKPFETPFRNERGR